MQNGLSLIDRKNIRVFALIIFVVWSCSDVQKRTKPKKILSQDEMVDIYTDMLLLDGIYRTNPKKFDTYDLKPTAHIYNKFNIDSLTLVQNMEYYNLDFEANSKIYEQVQKNIEQKKTLVDSINKIKDSLAKLKRNKLKTKLKDSVPLSKKMIKIDQN